MQVLRRQCVIGLKKVIKCECRVKWMKISIYFMGKANSLLTYAHKLSLCHSEMFVTVLCDLYRFWVHC